MPQVKEINLEILTELTKETAIEARLFQAHKIIRPQVSHFAHTLAADVVREGMVWPIVPLSRSSGRHASKFVSYFIYVLVQV